MDSVGLRLRRAYRKVRWAMLRGGPGRTPRILTVPTWNGLLSFSNMDVQNAKGLYVQRAWEVELITRSMEYLRSEGYRREGGRDVMVDAGANIGMICIGMLKHDCFREAIAVEPGPENFELLTRNIVQNGMGTAIRAVPCALSDAPGEVEMELSEENSGDHRVRMAAEPGLMHEERRRTVRVPARTLDDVIAAGSPGDARRIGLVWVDVQGHEARLFEGARETLSRGVPVVSEFWPYGIGRSGITRERYVEIARSLFARFAVADRMGAGFESRSIDSLGSLFDAFPGPDEYGEIVLLPR